MTNRAAWSVFADRLTVLGIVTAVLCLPRNVYADQDHQDQDQDQEAPVTEPTDELATTPFTLQGFGDVNYVTRARDGEGRAFVNGALDLFVTSQLGDRWSALVELVLESVQGELITDLERFQFTFEHSDALRVSAGRVHNPLLRWPSTYHHGRFTHTPIDQPIIARWEDEPGLWPMHFVGVLAQGRFAGVLGPFYSFGVGNGRGEIVDEITVTGDRNRERAVIGVFGVTPSALPGLALSLSGYADEIPAAERLRERDLAVSGSYERGNVELRSEWSRMNHTVIATDDDYATTGWYVLAAYRLSDRFARVKPYVMVEGLDVAEGEAFLEGAVDERNWIVGVRWDASRWVALKVDFRSRDLEGSERFGAARAQIAVNF